MELKKIKENVYYLDGPANIGLLTNENREALLIDAGLDESIARKVWRNLENNSLQLKGIIITHAHADHFGGAEFLLRKSQAKLYAFPMEKSVIEHPLWEPIYLFGGVHPPIAMQNKFLLAPASKVEKILTVGSQVIERIKLEIVPLPGHCWEQIGVSCNEVLFCADAVFAPEVLSKHGIPLFTYLQDTYKTFSFLLSRKESYFLPAHGTLVQDIKPLVETNKSCLEEVSEYIISLLVNPQTTEKVLAECCKRWGITLNNQGQYYLMQATILSHLSHLFNEEKISTIYQNNYQYWLKK